MWVGGVMEYLSTLKAVSLMRVNSGVDAIFGSVL